MWKLRRRTRGTFGIRICGSRQKTGISDDEMSHSVREVNFIPGSPPPLDDQTAPLGQEAGQTSNSCKELVALETVQNPDTLRDHILLGPEQQGANKEIAVTQLQNCDNNREGLAVGREHQHSRGSSRSQDDVKENRSALRASTIWGKLLRLLRIDSPLGGREHGSRRRSRDGDHGKRSRGEGKSMTIRLRNLRNFFVPQSKQSQNSSARSRTQKKYYIIKDGEHSRLSKVPPNTERLKSLWSLTDSDQQLQHNSSAAEESTEELIPLLEYREIQQVNTAAGSQSARASAGRHLAPPWVLRKWNLKSSQKLLKIHPAKEVLFHRTDDADTVKYTCSIIMENRTKRYVAFKFKCTSPRGYLMKPVHGILAPNLRIEVKGVRIGDPALSSPGAKKDLFVIVTLPIPERLIENKAIGSKVFDRFKDQCSCEAVLRAAFSAEATTSKMSQVDEGAAMADDGNSSSRKRLMAIPEEPAL